MHRPAQGIEARVYPKNPFYPKKCVGFLHLNLSTLQKSLPKIQPKILPKFTWS
jgi:hypothetical protein